MTKKLSKDQLMDQFRIIHGNSYDYSLVDYIDNNHKVTIICADHGAFDMLPSNHKIGQGCPKCKSNKLSEKFRKDQTVIIQEFRKIHKEFYDYSKVNYINGLTKIIVLCPEHGEFLIRPKYHLRGSGCKICGEKNRIIKRSHINSRVIEKFKEIYKDKYDYSKVQYVNDYTKVIIICKEHGEFLISPGNHKANHECMKCASGNVSKIENEWLDLMNIPDICRQQNICISGKRIRVDAFDSTTNTVYEFWGDYWHGNPMKYKSYNINVNNKKTFGELYEATQQKRRLILDAGYNLIEKWENDFLKKVNY